MWGETAGARGKVGEDGLPITGENLLSTAADVAFGTAAYMSPEQVRGENLDARTDLFSFGLVLYEIATGRQAFTGETARALREAILNRTPPSARELNPEVPVKLEEIISKALEKDRELRYQTALEIHTSLQGLKQEMNLALPNSLEAIYQYRKANGAHKVQPQTPRWTVFIAGVFALLLTVCAIFWFTKKRLWSEREVSHLTQRQLTTNNSENPV